MVFDLKQLFIGDNATLPVDYSLDLREMEVDQGCPFVEPVKISGTMSNHSGVIRLSYNAEFPFRKPCDRCAVETTHRFSYAFDHILVDKLHGEDTGEYIVLEEYQLDMDELAISDILLELPSKYLCKEDCKGLCPQCGANWIVESCSCSAKRVDPRLEILKSLIK